MAMLPIRNGRSRKDDGIIKSAALIVAYGPFGNAERKRHGTGAAESVIGCQGIKGRVMQLALRRGWCNDHTADAGLYHAPAAGKGSLCGESELDMTTLASIKNVPLHLRCGKTICENAIQSEENP